MKTEVSKKRSAQNPCRRSRYWHIIRYPNSQVRNYTYDDQGRLTQIANTIGAGSLGTFGYGYDSPLLGQRTSMTCSLGTTNYSYDSNYQLTGATYPSGAPFNGEVHSWTYDNIGNRLTNTVNSVPANYTYYTNGSNPLNGQRLQSDGVKTYTYDSNGNMIGDGTYTYTWDYENRMVGITGAGLTTSYSYDYLGRRTSKTVNGVITSYLYDGQNLIKESSASNVDYVFGPGIDEPIAMYANAVVSYFDVDGLGSLNALNDSAGALQNSYVFDAWGVVRSQSAIVPNPFTYTARETAEAGLMYYRARYYSPAIGRFMSEDPSSERFDDELVAYVYVGNRPSIRIDPIGLAASTAKFRPPRTGCKNTRAITSKLSGKDLPCDEYDPWISVLVCPPGFKRVFWDEYYGDIPDPAKFATPKAYTQWITDFRKACSDFTHGRGKSLIADGWHSGGGQGGVCCDCIPK